MSFVKICGITSLEDALAACRAGADLLGFNFYPPSPRSIQPEACARITSAVSAQFPNVRLVGVFVNLPAPEVRAILDRCGLHLAQLHGDEPPAALEQLAGRAFKAFRGLPEVSACREFAALVPRPPAFLLDAFTPGLYGGSGQTADWSGAAHLARSYPLLLAGGLNPANVAGAVMQVRPWGVDTASGVESSPGKKDHRKLYDFIAAVRSVDGAENI